MGTGASSNYSITDTTEILKDVASETNTLVLGGVSFGRLCAILRPVSQDFSPESLGLFRFQILLVHYVPAAAVRG
jgi:hypothetical protein